MIQTRIYPVTGFHVDVQESYQEVECTIMNSINTGLGMAIFTLENGEKVAFMISNIAYFTKY